MAGCAAKSRALEAYDFNLERIDAADVASLEADTTTLHATLPPSIDTCRTASDTRARDLEITMSKVDGGFWFLSGPEWGRRVGLELRHLCDHLFGLTEPLRPDNRLTHDLAGTTVVVDEVSEAASMQAYWATSLSSLLVSSNGSGAVYDTFARGE